MDRAFYWRVGLITASMLFAAWLLVPTAYYFSLPEKERDQDRKLESVLPKWAPSAKTKLNLGLDLKGGVHLVLGVDTQTALKAKISRRADQIVIFAKDRGFSGIKASADGLKVRVTADSKDDLSRFEKTASEYFGDMRSAGSDSNSFSLMYDEQVSKALKDSAVDQALKVITNRVNAWGVTEPIIAKRGDNAILVQLPGEQDPVAAKERVGRTAQLEFKIVDDESNYLSELYDALKKNPPQDAKVETETTENGGSKEYISFRGVKISRDFEHVQGLNPPYLKAVGDKSRKVLEDLGKVLPEPKVPADREIGIECIQSKEKANSCDGYRAVLLKSKIELTGESLVNAEVERDQSPTGGGKPYVSLTFDTTGAADFERITGENIRKRMAILLDQTIYSAPVIQAKIGGGHAQITLGGLRPHQEMLEEARELALVLKAGALPAPVTVGEERTVGAALGPELIRKGQYAVLVGFALVVLFMLLYYKTTGAVANVALLLNGLLNLAAMAAFNATLTLPGIASFVLTLGIAVDANVLINERIREELRHGKTMRAAIEAGYGRAFWTIFDSHITTLIAGLVLYHFGSGPVRGFAVMLMIGIVASLYTSIVVTRAIMDWLVIGRGWHKISV